VFLRAAGDATCAEILLRAFAGCHYSSFNMHHSFLVGLLAHKPHQLQCHHHHHHPKTLNTAYFDGGLVACPCCFASLVVILLINKHRFKEKNVRKLLLIASYFIQNSTIKCTVSEFEGLIQSLDFLEGFESPRDLDSPT
jgi:hypothetical protein